MSRDQYLLMIVLLPSTVLQLKKLLSEFAKDYHITLCYYIIDLCCSRSEEVFFLFRITYYYYTFIGTAVVIVVGLLVSYFTKPDTKILNKDLITPLMHWALPEESIPEDNIKYYNVEKAMNMLTIETNKLDEDKLEFK